MHLDDVAATINLKKILRIGVYEQAKIEETRSHSEDQYYSFSRSLSPSLSSSSLVSPARSSTSGMSSRASTSTGSYFSGPAIRHNHGKVCHKSKSSVNRVLKDEMNSNDVAATIHLKKILCIGADEQNEHQDTRSMTMAALIANTIADHYSHLRYKDTRRPSSTSSSSSVASARSRSRYTSGISLLPSSSIASKQSSDDEDHVWQQHKLVNQSRMIQEWYRLLWHFHSPSPCELPKPPAHWLTTRAVKKRNSRIQTERNLASSVGDIRPRKKNIIEMLRSSSAPATEEVEPYNMAHHSDLVTENLKMLLKVKPMLVYKRNEW